MKQHVLLIDDERSFRAIMESALEAEGFEVTTAADLASGRAAWKASAPDVLIIDRNLPDGDGVDLLSELQDDARARNLQTNFFVVTAYADVDNAVLALQRGADDYLTKPVQLADLLTKLRKASERRRLERQLEALRRRESDVSLLLARTRNEGMKRVLEMARRVAESPDTPVAIHGESGTGKDLIARLIHAHTPGRADHPMVELNCAAITEQLAESELFGHERGAFTDAREAKRGLLELADQSSLFLDEIADLGLGVQGKLLRVLETMRFRRVGGTSDREVDVRVISATHRDLRHAVDHGRFRLDLFHRLDVFQLNVPPLRARKEDVLPLAQHFAADTAKRIGRPTPPFDDDAKTALLGYPFPGNVRELKNVMERAVILAGSSIGVAELRLGDTRAHPARDRQLLLRVELAEGESPPTLKALEARYLAAVLERTGGNKTQAARILGVTFPTIQKKLRDYGLE